MRVEAKRLLGFVLVYVVLIAGAQGTQAQATPNVLFYLTDDLGYGDLDCYGAKGQDTPAIDQLAREGTRFSHFYVHQRCSPSRAAFMAEFETTSRPVGDATGDPDKNFKLDRSEAKPADSVGKKRNDRKNKRKSKDKK